MVDILKALADENRIRILNLLFAAELCVCEIETMLDMTQSNASRHLTKLKSAKIISSYKSAQWVHYKLDEDFENNNVDLIKYLKKKTFKSETCLNDLKRYHKYLESSLSCTDIRIDSNRVLDIISR